MMADLMIFRKLWGKICSTLAGYMFTQKWSLFWWRQCGYKIGKNTHIGPGFLIFAFHHLDKSYVVIENNVAIGPRVMLIARSNSLSQIEEHGKVTISIPGKIIIKKGAWVGAGAIILPNITIGECAAIGAGAVVTKNVPAYSVVAGIPAKIIKKLKRNYET